MQDSLNASWSVLADRLQERVALLDRELAALNARIGRPVSSPAHPEIAVLGRELSQREQQRRQHEQQLWPLRRWLMRREIGSIDDQITEIDRELAVLLPVNDPSDPTAELPLLRRSDLRRRKEQLVRALTSTATEYEQFDPRWGAVRYGQSPACTNIQAAGCGPTSLAILLNYLYQEDPQSAAASGEMEIVTPPQTASYAATHGRVCNSGTVGDTMVTNVHTGWPGFRGRRIGPDEATTQLRSGNLVIFLCHSCTGRTRSGSEKTYGGHFMVLNGVNADATLYDVLDPGAREAGDIETIPRSELRSHTSGFWIVERM